LQRLNVSTYIATHQYIILDKIGEKLKKVLYLGQDIVFRH